MSSEEADSIRPINELENQLQDLLDELLNNTDNSTASVDPFDINLPTEHLYLGSLERVSGVDCLEPGQLYKLPICYHPTLIFPGEQVPMVIPASMFSSEFGESNQDDGCLFGLIFPSIYDKTSPKLYGVTCQIYEKGTHNIHQLFIKSRACQRFVVTRPHNNSFADILTTSGRNQMYANVEILPEIVLPNPVLGIETNSVSKFRNASVATTQKVRRFEVGRLPWPEFVYDQYDVEKTIAAIRETMTNLKIESMPTDQIAMSFWCGKNVQLPYPDRIAAFTTNSVTKRLLIIGKAIVHKRFFACRSCNIKLAYYSSLFIMSKDGVNANYCNKAGYTHETITLTEVLSNATILTSGRSAEFSWFPGYVWQTMSCSGCYSHLGWKFSATCETLQPQSFFALAGSGTVVVSGNVANLVQVREESEFSSDTETLDSSGSS